MYIIDTSEIPSFPKDLLLGSGEIQELAPGSLPFIDQDFLKQLTNIQRKNEYITSRVLFAHMVDHLGWDITQVVLDKEQYGKPIVEVDRKKAFVSFTHSKSQVFCAISKSLDIGLDCEQSDRIVNNQVVKRILSTQEWSILGEEDPITLWTVKEAAVKSLGTGLRTNLKEIELTKESPGNYTIQINAERKMRGICFQHEKHHVSLVW